MTSQAPGWTNFWKSERHAFDDVMRLATQYFAKRFSEEFDLRANIHIFDYGCGPGFLADALSADKAVTFSGADINAYFIDLCKQTHPGAHFFTIHADPRENVALLRENLPRRADYIILLSISQYLASPEELEGIISSLKPHLNAGGSIIVADVVDEHTRSYRDALALLSHALNNGKLAAFLRFMRYVLGAQYASVARATRLQQISESFINAMAERQELSCRKMSGLTFHPTRKNYILRMKEDDYCPSS